MNRVEHSMGMEMVVKMNGKDSPALQNRIARFVGRR